MTLAWEWLGRVGFDEAAAAQEARRDRILAGDAAAQALLFLEHDPVITLGRSSSPGELLVPEAELRARGVSLRRASRGGGATAHGPGQLVLYPVVRLHRGVLWHVETVGRAIADELAARGVAAAWRRDPAGVWVGDAKIAACGIHVRRRVAVHGFALNVTRAPLDLFALIVPCGLRDRRVTALAAEVDAPPPALTELAAALAARLRVALIA
ncbi:MAG TPA: lipoyl(octanoyl) transferase LipB [Haliangiales bacterium]|nr:lipoyl(octanoyl) transferase LipB [Haliangiales bacterium]